MASALESLSPRKIWPVFWIETNTGSLGLGVGSALDGGRSTWTFTVASGAATMKIIRSTNMTSTNGTTLISELSE